MTEEGPMTDPTPTEPTTVTRARATTSGAPRRVSRPKAAAPEAPEVAPAAANVDADAVSVSQGGITNVNAHTVEVRQGGIAYAQADDITVTMGGVALARADRLNVELGGMGISFARETHLSQGAARSVVAQDVRIDQGLVGTMVAGRATFDRPSGVFLLIAGRVEGPVKALLDWRSALAFGAAFGLLWGIVRRR
jgi:hypothetical protein